VTIYFFQVISASCQSPTFVNYKTRECTELQFLGLILISCGAKTYWWKPSISTYFVQISSGYPLISRSSMTTQGNQMFPVYVRECRLSCAR